MPRSEQTLDRSIKKMVDQIQKDTGLSEEEIVGIAENTHYRNTLEALNHSPEVIDLKVKEEMEGSLHFMQLDNVGGMLKAVESETGFTPSQSAQIFKGSGNDLQLDIKDLLQKKHMIEAVKQAGDLSHDQLAEALEGEGKNIEPALKVLHSKLNPDQPDLTRLDQKMTSFVERLRSERPSDRNR